MTVLKELLESEFHQCVSRYGRDTGMSIECQNVNCSKATIFTKG
jgi:hypothetical protein